MPNSHEPIMALVRASLDPASREAERRVDSPACRVVTQAARADADAGGAGSLHLLAMGAAVAATGLTVLLAEHRNVPPEAFLDTFEEAQQAHDGPGGFSATPLLRSLLLNDRMQSSAEMVVQLFNDDQEKYFDLIVELGDYAATCIGFVETLRISTVDETLADLDRMLRDFVGA
jgi:hypothetical protein